MVTNAGRGGEQPQVQWGVRIHFESGRGWMSIGEAWKDLIAAPSTQVYEIVRGTCTKGAHTVTALIRRFTTR